MERKNGKSLVFAGQFEIGEQLTPLHIKIVREAVKLCTSEKADLAILVGDIGVAQKIEAYMRGGVKAVEAIYLDRIKNATSGVRYIAVACR